MRKLILIGLFPLAACVSQQATCISNASKDLQVLNKLIAETQGNINRGYAIGVTEEWTTEEQPCGADNKGNVIYCEVPVVEQNKAPVAIDLASEQAKLASMLNKQAELLKMREQAVSMCQAKYPDS